MVDFAFVHRLQCKWKRDEAFDNDEGRVTCMTEEAHCACAGAFTIATEETKNMNVNVARLCDQPEQGAG